MKKYKFHSLVHNYYKELCKARKLNKPLWPLLRVVFLYFKQNRCKIDRMELNIPWLTNSSVKFLDHFVKPGNLIFEFGSGSSTCYFLNKKAKVISVEHDLEWYNKVLEKIESLDNKDIVYKLIEPVKKEYSKYNLLSDKDKRFIGYDYFDYSSSILFYDNESFDVVLIDGRVRSKCVLNSISKVKKGGILIIDNAERKEYSTAINEIPFKNVLNEYGFVQFDLGFTQTSIFLNK